MNVQVTPAVTVATFCPIETSFWQHCRPERPIGPTNNRIEISRMFYAWWFPVILLPAGCCSIRLRLEPEAIPFIRVAGSSLRRTIPIGLPWRTGCVAYVGEPLPNQCHDHGFEFMSRTAPTIP